MRENKRESIKRHIKSYYILYAFFTILILYTVYSIYSYKKDSVKVSLILPIQSSFTFELSSMSIVELNDVARREENKYKAVFKVESDGDGIIKFYKTDGVTLNITSTRGKMIKTTIADIIYEENIANVVIEFNDVEELAGATVDLEASKVTTVLDNVFPRAAIHKDEKGYYLYQVKQSDGAWGKEYNIQKVPVTIFVGDLVSASVKSYELKYPVVLNSEVEPYDGMRVRFYP